MALALSSCGGGGTSGGSTSGGSSGGIISPSPTPTPSSPSAGACALRARQDWVLSSFNSWYLFPETMGYVNPAAFTNLLDYVDALAAGARAQGRDRYFSYVTSIAEENAYYQSGETAGLGVRFFTDPAARRLWVSESFEGAPALAVGIDRGTEILAIGTSPANLRSVSSILASEGEAGLYYALGPNTAGTARVLDVQDSALGRRTVTVTKADFNIQPVSSRYGVRILEDNGRKIGYVNLRTFISPANDALRNAFGQLKAQGVQDVIVDFRYNGGGAVSVAQTLASLMGADRRPSDVVALLRFRPERSAENDPYYFRTEANAIAPRRIAFIATDSTASASEMVINAFRPFLPTDIALIGENTYGKPVGQIALDKPECDDRLRLIAFAVENAAGDSGYYNGLAPRMQRSCRARDELAYPLGDQREDMVARAVDFIQGRSCPAISGSGIAQSATASSTPVAPLPDLRPLTPARPTQPQREMPGLF